jgi:hypothetical protein
MLRQSGWIGFALGMALLAAARAAAETPVSLADYDPNCEVRVTGWNGHLRLNWPLSE